MIIIAKINFNKNLIFQSAPFLIDEGREPEISLIIISLKVIQAGQKKAIKKKFNSKDCILNGDSNT